MWIRWHDRASDTPKLINTRHLLEFKVSTVKIAQGHLYELVAAPSKKDNHNQNIIILSSKDKESICKIVKHIYVAIEKDEKVYRVPDLE